MERVLGVTSEADGAGGGKWEKTGEDVSGKMHFVTLDVFTLIFFFKFSWLIAMV